MSKSPLAGAFAAGSTPEKKKNKKGAALLLIAGIGMTASLGGVFAANSITINSGSAIQFGQGVASTNSCVTGLTTTMTQTYVNASSDFDVDSVTIDPSGADFSDCNGKRLILTLRDTNGSALSGGTKEPDVAASAATGIEILGSATNHSVSFSSAAIEAGTVAKITVTTE